MGEMGGGQGDGAALSPPGVGAGEVVGRGRAPVATPVGGTGGKVTQGGAGPAVVQLGQVGRSGLRARAAWSSEGGGLFLFFSLFIFSVLFHFKILRQFLKIFFLHNNYQCIIWHPPNIFVLTFENFYRLI